MNQDKTLEFQVMNIFIVEDDHVLQLMLQKMIERMGHQLAGTAINGSEAIELIRSSSPDLILMDIQLKDHIDGIQVVETIKDEMDPYVIYITGNSDQIYRDRAKEHGYADYMIKPISFDSLKKSISNLNGSQ